MIGEQLNRKVQLINKGALGTKFKIVDAKELLVQNSGRETDSETNSCEFNSQTGDHSAEGIRLGDVTKKSIIDSD